MWFHGEQHYVAATFYIFHVYSYYNANAVKERMEKHVFINDTIQLVSCGGLEGFCNFPPNGLCNKFIIYNLKNLENQVLFTKFT